jgi:hypothetical protein
LAEARSSDRQQINAFSDPSPRSYDRPEIRLKSNKEGTPSLAAKIGARRRNRQRSGFEYRDRDLQGIAAIGKRRRRCPAFRGNALGQQITSMNIIRRSLLFGIGCLIGVGAIIPSTAADLRFNEANFMAMHNSYAGEGLGSIEHQLDFGARFIELDIHDTDFASFRDYRVGHDGPGLGVQLGHGNPDTPNFSVWLARIRTWSDRHPHHAPITLGIDVKDATPLPKISPPPARSGLADNPSYAAGDLVFLNDQLRAAFGKKLFSAESIFRGLAKT